ncbi:MAG TPA: urea ABC transporter permease subunit UrtC [Tepidisphaeraceae bacterium]|nr:urea ABC transporter permease subunit UrtC [Tepidisphaeraceae bacterium]
MRLDSFDPRRWSTIIAVTIALISGATARPSLAQGAPATQPVAAAGDVSVEDQIRARLPALSERESGLAALKELEAMRDARVLRVFQRIQDRTLYQWDGQFVYLPGFRDEPSQGQVADVYDLFTETDEAGAPLGVPLATVPKADVKDFAPPRPVRTQVLNALRVLGLKVDDAAVRRVAARELGNRRQADALPELRQIAESDPDAKVRHTASESVNLIVAASTDPAVTSEQKLAAVAALGELESIRALDLLKDQSNQPNLAPADAAVYRTAIEKIEWHLSVTNWIKNIFFGLSAGSIYVLLALGLAITFGLMGVINMAHGEMLMIGAVSTWACHEFLIVGQVLPPEWFNWYYVIAFPVSFLTAATVGLLIEVSIVRWLYKRPLDSLLATIGVSYVLIQAVRNQFSDNLGMRKPTWAGRSLEVMQDVNFAYNRLFLIALTVFCLLSVVAVFRYTRLGLMIRATVQNREMAQALGVNTRLVDMVTFAFGAGLAGLAGYGIVLTSNPSPEIGQTFVVKSFLTVVVGGVGKLAGVIFSGLGLGFTEKLLEPIVLIEQPLRIFDATWAQVAALVAVIFFMQRRPAGLFPDKGRAADQADRTSMPFLTSTTRKGDYMLGGALVFLGLVLVPFLYGTGLMSLEYVNKLGYVLAFAICAIGLDLIWGYIGILSLMQFLFFALGGYCMGLYLINYGPKAPDGIPMALSYVMSDVSGRKAPWFLSMFESFPLTLVLGLVLPGSLALLIGLSTFRSRVRGVYFSILTQAITVAFWLIFQKNDLKLGGTNGLTNFTHILGFPIQADAAAGKFMQTRFWLYIVSFVTLIIVLMLAKWLVNSGFGRVLVAIRDDETRLRFVGYQTWAYKAAAFTLAAMFAAVGGMLYVPQKGIINPHMIAAIASIQVVAWVAVGGRGSLWGAVIGAIFVSLVYEYMTSVAPQYWYFVLGGLFILVPLLLPGGIMSIPKVISGFLSERRGRATDPLPLPLAAEPKIADGRSA